MKTVTFTWPHQTGGYGCNQPGDQSGEYVRAGDANYLLGALKGMVEMYEAFMDKAEHARRFYDAKTIRLLNEKPGIAMRLIEKFEKNKQ